MKSNSNNALVLAQQEVNVLVVRMVVFPLISCMQLV